ncbi:MAG: hypothetical protein CBARDCOR_3509 [uncultured Caballeronia sp.]|nr:MAG: hypothetical protein CBARDCOR_3509 [uncultured Caballeronia sp.]
MPAPALSLVTAIQLKAKPYKADTSPQKSEIESQLPGSELPCGNRMYLHTSLKGVQTRRWAYRLFDSCQGADGQYEVKLGVWPAMSLKQADAARANAWADFVQKGQHPPSTTRLKPHTRHRPLRLPKRPRSGPRRKAGSKPIAAAGCRPTRRKSKPF